MKWLLLEFISRVSTGILSRSGHASLFGQLENTVETTRSWLTFL